MEELEAEFRCGLCDGIAAVVQFVPKGLTFQPGGYLSIDSERIRIAGFRGDLEAVISKDTDSVILALKNSDACALWQIEPLWAPFYCEVCGKSYCESHWTAWDTFAEDLPGWYEDTHGVCPRGHKRLLED